MSTEHILNIQNLSASIDDKKILKNINLKIRPNEIHAIMGPNGSGKSTLASLLAGRPDYVVHADALTFLGQDLLNFSVDERARLGIFLAFQYPVEIPGVSTINLIKAAMNERRKENNLAELDAMDFYNLVKSKLELVGVDQDFLYRSVNTGFSGGEKKRSEILQMALLEPKLAILDEIDSGLDIDALKIVSDGVNRLRDGMRSFIVVTHYQRLLNYIVPDYVHVLVNGEIVKSGDYTLALELEQKGYGWLGGTT